MFKQKSLLRDGADYLLDLYNNHTPKYMSQISRDTLSSLSNVGKKFKVFEKAGLVTFRRYGRVKEYKLTKKGIEVAQHLNEIIHLMKE